VDIQFKGASLETSLLFAQFSAFPALKLWSVSHHVPPKGSTVPCAGIIILHINYRKDVAELYITYIYMTYMDMLFTCIYIKLSCSVDAHTRAMSQSQAICIVGVFSKNCHTEKNTKNGNLKKKDTTQVLQDTH
jgi:hypothetical protein